MKAPTGMPMFDETIGVVSTPAWVQYFQQLSDYYEKVQKWTNPLAPKFGQVEPPHVTGLLAYADGVNWNPLGAGAGYYYWSGAAWTQL